MTQFVRWKNFLSFFRATSIRDCPTFRNTLLYLAFARKLANFTSQKSRRDALCQRDRRKENVLLFSFFFWNPHERRDATFTPILSSRDTSYRALCTQTTPGIFLSFSFFFFFLLVSPRFVRGTIFPSLNERANLRAAPLCFHITRLCRLSGRERETRDCLSSSL